MDILVPLPDFVDSSAVFSDADLKQQVTNISRALDAIHEVAFIPLQDNPFVQMWRGHETQLAEYGLTLAEEYISRQDPESSVFDTSAYENIQWHMQNATGGGDFSMAKPAWFGDIRVHDSHKAALLRKDKEWYSQQFGDISSDTDPYFP